VVVPAVIVAVRRGAALGLHDDRFVAVQLDEVELATDTEGRGLEVDAAARSLEQLGEERVVGVGEVGGVGGGDGTATASSARTVVLGAALYGVGGVDEVALHVLEVEEARAVDQLVAHADRKEVG